MAVGWLLFLLTPPYTCMLSSVFWMGRGKKAADRHLLLQHISSENNRIGNIKARQPYPSFPQTLPYTLDCRSVHQVRPVLIQYVWPPLGCVCRWWWGGIREATIHITWLSSPVESAGSFVDGAVKQRFLDSVPLSPWCVYFQCGAFFHRLKWILFELCDAISPTSCYGDATSLVYEHVIADVNLQRSVFY